MGAGGEQSRGDLITDIDPLVPRPSVRDQGELIGEQLIELRLQRGIERRQRGVAGRSCCRVRAGAAGRVDGDEERAAVTGDRNDRVVDRGVEQRVASSSPWTRPASEPPALPPATWSCPGDSACTTPVEPRASSALTTVASTGVTLIMSVLLVELTSCSGSRGCGMGISGQQWRSRVSVCGGARRSVRTPTTRRTSPTGRSVAPREWRW
jgi:hypothetical protein